MSRVINVNSPGKARSQAMRTGAEVLRRLVEKTSLDDETRDMVAYLVFCFRAIDEGIEESVKAWEKRDYWIKAEQFRIKWAWVRDAAHDLESILREDAWERLPQVLVKLLPHFEDIKVVKYTRSPKLWQNAYEQLLHQNGKSG
ncbi:MAG: hypothetical protein Kow00124_07840 [Anaerolineae bacterium]